MATLPITEETDCAACAGQNVLPVLDFEYIQMPPYEDRKDYLDLKRMEGFLETYQVEEKKVIAAHNASVEIFRTWATRMDSVFAKTVVIQRSIGKSLGDSPTDDFEEFELFDASITYGAILSAITSLYGIYSGVKAVRAVGELGAEATRMQKFVARGGLALTVVTTAISLTIIFINEKRRTEALVQAIPDFQSWLYGKSESTNNIIENPNEETARGAVGQVNEIHAAVAQMKARIIDLAEAIGVPTVEGDDEPIDPEIIYCEVEKALLGSIKTGAEIEAAFAVATRMICLDINDDNITFSDADISKATGLPDTLIARRRSDVIGDPSLCDL